MMLIALALTAAPAKAQQPSLPGSPGGIENAPQRDTTNRKNNPNWRDEPVRIYARRAASEAKIYPDTGLHTLHHIPYLQPWEQDLGNAGSAARSLFFRNEVAPEAGPSLGYHAFDIYRFEADSLLYFNTTRPYTDFNYRLGSKLEQMLQVTHTQNISPRWNFAARYRKLTSQGFYRIQRTNHDNGSLSTSYQSKSQRYQLFGAFVYNKEQQDENGGITSDTFLNKDRYTDRNTVPVAFENTLYSTRRSTVTTTLRDYDFHLQHAYTWGRIDTTYNKDSTQYTATLTPRFSIAHRFDAGAQRYQFKNLLPDSAFYTPFFRQSFTTTDSVFSRQDWAWVDNAATLNGFFGPRANGVLFTAGAGIRSDAFTTDYIRGKDRSSTISNYLTGAIRKEASAPGQFFYNADAKLIFTGSAAGNFSLKAAAGKDFKRWGTISAAFSQVLAQAPYSYTRYQNQYTLITANLSSQSTTLISAAWNMPRWKLSAGLGNTLIANYIYLTDTLHRVTNGPLTFSQQSSPFSIGQVWLRKAFELGNFVLDNELAAQQITGSAPLDVPALTGRHTLSFESYVFKKALKVAAGADVRYRTGYRPQAYAPLYNRCYYQEAVSTGTQWESSVFFNFKVKRFRASLSVDELQSLLGVHNVPTPGYPVQELMIRFGFDWILVN